MEGEAMTEVTGPGGPQGGGNVVDKAIDQAEQSGDEYKEIAGDAEQTGANDMAYYLKLQRAMMQEQQAYTAVSTIMKARSDASLTAIRNFK
jgi:hypothetical protein